MKFEVKKSIRNMAKAGVLAGSLLGLSMAGQSANAASGQTSVDIDFPPLIILYYYDSLSIDVSEADLISATGAGGASCTSASAPGIECSVTTGPISATYNTGTSAFEGSVDIDGDAPALAGTPSVVSFDIAEAWGVRSLGVPSLNATFGQGTGDFVAGSVSSDLNTVSSSLVLDPTNGNVGNIEFQVDLSTLVANAAPGYGLTASDTFTVTVAVP